MSVGIGLAFRPLVVFADVIPSAGSLVGFGVAVISALIASVLALFVIGVAWLFFRPLLAVGLFSLGGVLIYFVIRAFQMHGRASSFSRSAPSG